MYTNQGNKIINFFELSIYTYIYKLINATFKNEHK